MGKEAFALGDNEILRPPPVLQVKFDIADSNTWDHVLAQELGSADSRVVGPVRVLRRGRVQGSQSLHCGELRGILYPVDAIEKMLRVV